MQAISKKHKVQWCDRKLVVSHYYYCLVLNEETYEEELKSLDIKLSMAGPWISQGSRATAHFFEHASGRLIAIVCLNDSSKMTAVEKVSILVHEAVHIWQYICNAIGENNPSKEFEAYSIQSITEELLHAYDRAKADLKKSVKKPCKEPVKLTQGRSSPELLSPN